MAKKKKNSISIQWKIFGFLFGFCMLLLLILWLFQTVFLDSFYRHIKASSIEKESAVLAEMIEAGDMTDYEDLFEKRSDVFVELFDAEGTMFFLDEGNTGSMHSFLKLEERKQIYQQTVEQGGYLSMVYTADDSQPPRETEGSKRAPYIREKKHNNDNILSCTVVQMLDGEERVLMVRALLNPVQSMVSTLRVQLLYISIIMVVLALIIALLLSRRVSSPIERLNSTAKMLSDGNYDLHFCDKGYREVEELSATLDKAAKELAKTDALRRDLIANVSHDLRTPLTLITGYAEMMRDIPSENNAENMQTIIDEANRLSSLVDDLLQLSQLQAGISTFAFDTFDISAEIRDIVERLAKFVDQQGYTITCTLTENALVYADKKRIEQVIYNFILNAMTHSGEDKIILVEQVITADRVDIRVIDHGEGIEETMLPYIWDRYYKVNKVHKRALAGAGLGLSIVKSILDQHPDIEYGVESTPGEGSVFWFSLPRMPASKAD